MLEVSKNAKEQKNKRKASRSRDYAYFVGDKGFWDDGDFITSDQQLVYAMLWQSHGTDIAGIRPRNDRLDAARVHMSLKRFQDTLSILYTGGKVGLYDTRIWVKSAIWHNLGKGHYSSTQLAAVKCRLMCCGSPSIVKEIILYYKQKYGLDIPYPYPTDTLPIPHEYPTPSGLDWTGLDSSGLDSTGIGLDSSGKKEDTTVGTLPEAGQSDPKENQLSGNPGTLPNRREPEPEEMMRREYLQKMLPYLDPEIIPYMPKDEKDKYKLAGWIVKRCLNRPEVAVEFLHQQANYLSGLKDMLAFRKVVTKITQDAETMGRIESVAHRNER